uniref:Core-2/I-Branching enzyme n=1 Tax=Gongylonema pulchrum TaxID=637853 RepID=A0A183E8C1_9BILA
LQELLLNLMYAPQNFYCYALDAKSSALFHEQMRALSVCFPNVFLTKREFTVDSAGHNTSRSFLECLRIVRKMPGWRYAILLQNNDIPLKSNLEMVQILQALNGSNDINVGYPNADRMPKDAPWTFRSLRLFRDVKENDERVLRIAKGSTSASLSEAFVKFVLDKLDLTVLLDKLDELNYGGDEMLFSSLHSEDLLDAPGGFTRQCIDNYNNMITRYVVWRKSPKFCRSGLLRHDICVLGIADLPALSASRALFANKMLPEFDYTAIGCWANALHNRTYSFRKISQARLQYYASRLPTKFHSEREKWRSGQVAFNCSCC